MNRIIIGTIVGAIIFFGYQAAMWMGGIHSNYTNYTPRQDSIMAYLNQNLAEEGLYMMPTVDPAVPDRMAAEEEMMKQSEGKPWAMVFYHKRMMGMEPSYLLMGFVYALIAALLVSLVLYAGNFLTFGTRFLVSLAFGGFALAQGVMDEMNWWSYPWSFIQPQVLDLTLGWGICSLWLAFYVRRKLVVVPTVPVVVTRNGNGGEVRH
jgi:hypothetical protein